MQSMPRNRAVLALFLFPDEPLPLRQVLHELIQHAAIVLHVALHANPAGLEREI